MDEKTAKWLRAAALADVKFVSPESPFELSRAEVERQMGNGFAYPGKPEPAPPFSVALANCLRDLQVRLDEIEVKASILRDRYLGDAPPMALAVNSPPPDVAVAASTLERIAECHATAIRALDHLITLDARL